MRSTPTRSRSSRPRYTGRVRSRAVFGGTRVLFPEDTYLVQTRPPGAYYGADPDFLVGYTGLFEAYRAVLRFDLRMLVKTVTSAVLNLYCESAVSGSVDFSARVHYTEPLAVASGDFVENEADWVELASGKPWITAGGDFKPTPTVSWTLPLVTGWLQIDLTTLVNDSYPVRNWPTLFFLKRLNESGDSALATFTSKDGTHAQRPYLEVKS